MTVITGNAEVKKLSPNRTGFQILHSTEGEFGIVVEATLKLRDMPESAYPHLLYFPGDKEAFTFIASFVKERVSIRLIPITIRFLDENQNG